MKPEDIDKAVRAAINSYLMIVCIDKVITKYNKEPFNGFTTKHTYQSSWTDIDHTVFYIDSNNKSLKFIIRFIEYVELTKRLPAEFMRLAALDVEAYDENTGRLIGIRTTVLSKIAKAIEDILSAC